MIKVAFEDSEFRASHGRAPRGRGSWAFEVVGLCAARDRERLAPPVFYPSSTFAEARKAVRRDVRQACAVFGWTAGEVVLNVCP